MAEYYNGKVQNARRLYNSLRNFVGENKVHLPGDILCISLRNNDRYDLFLMADGVSTFIKLLKKYRDGEIAPVGQAASISREEIEAIIRSIGITPGPDSVGSKEIKDGSVELADLDPTIITTPEEAREIVAKATANAD